MSSVCDWLSVCWGVSISNRLSVGSGLSVSGVRLTVGDWLLVGNWGIGNRLVSVSTIWLSVGDGGSIRLGGIDGLSVGNRGGLSVTSDGVSASGRLSLSSDSESGEGATEGTCSEKTLKSKTRLEFLSESSVVELVLEGISTEAWELRSLMISIFFVSLNFEILLVTIDLDGILRLDFLSVDFELTSGLGFGTDLSISSHFDISVDLLLTVEFKFFASLKLRFDLIFFLEFYFTANFNISLNFELTSTISFNFVRGSFGGLMFVFTKSGEARR